MTNWPRRSARPSRTPWTMARTRRFWISTTSVTLRFRRRRSPEPGADVGTATVDVDTRAISALPEARSFHLGRWAISIVVVLLAALFIRVLATNPSLDWGVVAEYLFNPTVLDGVKNTIVITVLAQAIGIGGG